MRRTISDARDAVVVVMGISGSGKTTIGTALAERLDVPYADGDGFHSAANIEKMSRGIPLDDSDRAPWLAAIAEWLRERQAEGGGVVSCSALRRAYRDVLTCAAPRAFYLRLSGSAALMGERVRVRSGHFMPVSLLASQLSLLEPLQHDERGLVVDVDAPVGTIIDACLAKLRPFD